MTDDLVSTKEAAVICHLSFRTLEKRRLEGGGPPYYKVGRLVFYSVQELLEWIAKGRRISTSDPGDQPAAPATSDPGDQPAAP